MQFENKESILVDLQLLLCLGRKNVLILEPDKLYLESTQLSADSALKLHETLPASRITASEFASRQVVFTDCNHQNKYYTV